MIKFNYYDKDKFLIIKYSGIIDKPTLVSFMDFIFLRTDKISLEKVLNDFRNASIAFDLRDLPDILKLRVNYSEGFKNSLLAVYLVQEVKETVFTTLYAKEVPPNISKVKICSTIEFAIKLLGLSMTPEELESKINNLVSEF